MADLVSYVAELCFIVSISTLAHTCAISLKHCFPTNSPESYVLLTFILLYFFVRRLPVDRRTERSIDFLYWKYSIFALFAVLDYYGTLEGFSISELVGLFILWELLMLLMYGKIPRPPQVYNGYVVVTNLFVNGVAVRGIGFVHTITICILLILFLSGFLWLAFLKLYIGLVFRVFCACLVLQSTGIVDLSVSIPFPFDVLCFYLCHYTIGYCTGLEESFATGNVYQIAFSEFIMSSIATISFIYYYYCPWNLDM